MSYVSQGEKIFKYRPRGDPNTADCSPPLIKRSDHRLKRFYSTLDGRAWNLYEAIRYRYFYEQISGSQVCLNADQSHRFVPLDDLINILTKEKDDYIKELEARLKNYESQGSSKGTKKRKLNEKEDSELDEGAKKRKAHSDGQLGSDEGQAEKNASFDELLKSDEPKKKASFDELLKPAMSRDSKEGKEELKDKKATQNEIMALNQELNNSRDMLRKAMNKLQNIDEIINENKKLHSRLRCSEERVKFLEEKKKQLEKELADLRSKSQIQIDLDKAHQMLAEIAQPVEESTEGTNEEKPPSLSDERDELQKKVTKLEKELEELKKKENEIELLKSQSQSSSFNIEEISRENECYRKKLASMKCLEKQIQELKKQGRALADKYRRESQKAADQIKKMSQAAKELQALREERDSLKKRVDELSSLESQYNCLKKKLQRVDAVIAENEALNSKLMALDKLEKENEYLKCRLEQIREMEVNAAGDKERILQLESAVADQEEEMKDLLSQIDRLTRGQTDEELQRLRSELLEKNSKLKLCEEQLAEIPMLEAEIDELRSKLQCCCKEFAAKKTGESQHQKIEVRFPNTRAGISAKYKSEKQKSQILGTRREEKVSLEDSETPLKEGSASSPCLSSDREKEAMSCEEVQSLLQSSKEIISCVLEDMIEHQKEMEELEMSNRAMKEEMESLKNTVGTPSAGELENEIQNYKKLLETKEAEIKKLKSKSKTGEDEVDTDTLKELNQEMKAELEAACKGLKQIANLEKLLELERQARCRAEKLLKQKDPSSGTLPEDGVNYDLLKAQQKELDDLKLQIAELNKLNSELKKENNLLRELQQPGPDFAKELDEKCALENLLSLLQAELDAFKGQKLSDECEALRNELKRVMEQNCQLKALVDCYRQRLNLEKESQELGAEKEQPEGVESPPKSKTPAESTLGTPIKTPSEVEEGKVSSEGIVSPVRVLSSEEDKLPTSKSKDEEPFKIESPKLASPQKESTVTIEPEKGPPTPDSAGTIQTEEPKITEPEEKVSLPVSQPSYDDKKAKPADVVEEEKIIEPQQLEAAKPVEEPSDQPKVDESLSKPESVKTPESKSPASSKTEDMMPVPQTPESSSPEVPVVESEVKIVEVRTKSIEREKKPVEPEKKPVEPERKPVEPERKPVEPERKSAESDKKPVEPERKSDQSERKPVESERKLAEPQRKSDEPEKKPVEPERKSDQSEKKPVEPPRKSVEPERKPVESERKLAEPQRKSDDPDKKSVESAKQVRKSVESVAKPPEPAPQPPAKPPEPAPQPPAKPAEPAPQPPAKPAEPAPQPPAKPAEPAPQPPAKLAEPAPQPPAKPVEPAPQPPAKPAEPAPQPPPKPSPKPTPKPTPKSTPKLSFQPPTEKPEDAKLPTAVLPPPPPPPPVEDGKLRAELSRLQDLLAEKDAALNAQKQEMEKKLGEQDEKLKALMQNLNNVEKEKSDLKEALKTAENKANLPPTTEPRDLEPKIPTQRKSSPPAVDYAAKAPVAIPTVDPEVYQQRLKQKDEENEEKLRKLMEQHEKELANRDKVYNDNLNAMKSGYETDIKKLTERHKLSIMRLQNLHEDEVQDLHTNYETQMESMQTQSEEAMNDVAKGSAAKMKKLALDHERVIKTMEAKFHTKLEEKESQYLEEITGMKRKLSESLGKLEGFKQKSKEVVGGGALELAAKHSREIQQMKRSNSKRLSIMKAKYEEMLAKEREKCASQTDALKKKLKEQENERDGCDCKLEKKRTRRPRDPSCPLDFNEILEKILEEGLDCLTFNEIALVHRKICCALEGIVMNSDVTPTLEPSVEDMCPHTPLLEADKQQLLNRIFLLENEIANKQRQTQDAIINMEIAVKKERCRLQELRNVLQSEQRRNSELQLLLTSQTKLQSDLKKERDKMCNQATLQQSLCMEKAKRLDQEMKDKRFLEEEVEKLKMKVKQLCAALGSKRESFESVRKQECERLQLLRAKLEQSANNEQKLSMRLDDEVRCRMHLQEQIQALKQSLRQMVNLPALDKDVGISPNPLEVKSAKEKQNFDQIKEKKYKTKSKLTKKNKK